MQIRKIQNNNYSNPNFRAKLQLKGEKLPEELVSEFKTLVEKIGKDSDIVSIDIGEKCSDTIHWYERGKHYEETTYYRDNLIDSRIGRKRDDKIINSSSSDSQADMTCLRREITRYLNLLSRKHSKK